MKLNPLHDRVVVRRTEPDTKTSSGIIIPDNVAEKPDQGIVLAVGAGRRTESGTLVPMSLTVNDTVLFGKFAGQTVKIKGEEMLILKEEEIYAVQICQKLIMNPNSKLTNAPISFKRFIKNDDNNMFIVINNRTISLINHVYSYNVFIESFEPYSDICQLFDNEMEKRRQELEDEIKNNIQHSLKEILRKIS